jgi:hypothetical protein
MVDAFTLGWNLIAEQSAVEEPQTPPESPPEDDSRNLAGFASR